jgi:transcriptional antiterminator NusG
MAKNWYIIKVFTNFENKVKTAIDKQVKNTEIGKLIIDVKIPIEENVEMKNGKKKTIRKKFLPGYILAEIDMPDETEEWRKLLNVLLAIQGVSGFLGTTDRNKKPRPLPIEEAKEILQKMGDLKTPEIVVTKIDFSLGEQVKITDGAFQNFTGVIENILPDKGKVKVKVEIFGRSTLVEMDYLQVEKI